MHAADVAADQRAAGARVVLERQPAGRQLGVEPAQLVLERPRVRRAVGAGGAARRGVLVGGGGGVGGAALRRAVDVAGRELAALGRGGAGLLGGWWVGRGGGFALLLAELAGEVDAGVACDGAAAAASVV